MRNFVYCFAARESRIFSGYQTCFDSSRMDVTGFTFVTSSNLFKTFSLYYEEKESVVFYYLGKTA